jgi:hypothetical protein
VVEIAREQEFKVEPEKWLSCCHLIIGASSYFYG